MMASKDFKKKMGIVVADGPIAGKVTVVLDANGKEYTFDENGKKICGSKLRNQDKICKKPPMTGSNRCQLHGGKSLVGIAHPNFRHGRYSLSLPARLGEKYERATSDEQLLTLRDEIAVLEVRIGDLLERVESGESGALWRQIKKTYAKLGAASRSGDQQEFQEQLRQLGLLINRGAGDYQAWDEVVKTISNRRRLVETERKRLVDMQQMMTAEQAMTMLSFVVSVIKKNVTDQQTLAKISAEITNYIGQRNNFQDK